jgi:hypothetical protein
MIGINSGVDGDGRKNAMFGYQAGMYSDGNVNLYLGRSSGMNHRGDSCIFIGDGVGYNYTGDKKVLIDVMHRTDGTHLIDLEGSQDKRQITFNGKQLIAETNDFLIKNIPGSITKLQISSKTDTTLISSDNVLKLDGTQLFTNCEIIFNGLRTFSRSVDMENDREIFIAKGYHGWGTVQAGDDEAFAHFRFTTTGKVILYDQTENIIEGDEEGRFCIYFLEDNLAIKNRLGDIKRVNFTINYTNPGKWK